MHSPSHLLWNRRGPDYQKTVLQSTVVGQKHHVSGMIQGRRKLFDTVGFLTGDGVFKWYLWPTSETVKSEANTVTVSLNCILSYRLFKIKIICYNCLFPITQEPAHSLDDFVTDLSATCVILKSV